MSLQQQQQQQQSLAGGAMPFVELPLSTPTGGGLALPLLPTSALTQAQLQVMQAQLAQLAAAGRGGMPAAQHTAPTPSGSAGAAAVGGAQKGAKSKQKRLYKPPEQVQAEREEKVVVQVRGGRGGRSGWGAGWGEARPGTQRRGYLGRMCEAHRRSSSKRLGSVHASPNQCAVRKTLLRALPPPPPHTHTPHPPHTPHTTPHTPPHTTPHPTPPTHPPTITHHHQPPLPPPSHPPPPSLAQERIRKLEQQLERAKKELEQLQQVQGWAHGGWVGGGTVRVASVRSPPAWQRGGGPWLLWVWVGGWVGEWVGVGVCVWGGGGGGGAQSWPGRLV